MENLPNELAKADPAKRRRTPWDRLHAALLALVLTAFAAACLHGIANVWQWGHNGYNGAAFAQAARNSLRFETLGMAQYHTDPSPPKPSQLYVNHPILLHLHLIASFALFGYSEVAARAVPAIYSFLGLLVLYVFVRHHFGRWAALASVASYAWIPLTLIYANMVNHEQGSIFWNLLSMYFYTRWIEEARGRHFALHLLAITMAMQFDWPGYYFALFYALHGLSLWVRDFREEGWSNRHLLYVFAITSVVFFNVVVTTGTILWVRGSLEPLLHAFKLRTEEPKKYWETLRERVDDLVGAYFVATSALWLAAFTVRAAGRKLVLGDLLPLCFFLAQAVHSTVFKKAGYIHAYWIYHAAPALAVASGWLIDRTLRVAWKARKALLSLLGRAKRPRPAWVRGLAWIPPAVAAAGVAYLAGVRTAHAVDRLRWGFYTGHGAYVANYHDYWYEIAWVKDIASRRSREHTVYLLDTGLRFRIEVLSYLDARVRLVPGPAVAKRLSANHARRASRVVYLFDLATVRAPLGEVARLLRGHAFEVHDRRFVAVELHPAGHRRAAWLAERREAPWWWTWLVHPLHPPMRWVPDPQVEQLRSVLLEPPAASTTKPAGGRGGFPRTAPCPKGYVLAGADFYGQPGAIPQAIRPWCRPQGPQARAMRNDFWGLPLGRPRRRPRSLRCGAGSVATGIFGRSGALVDALGFECSPADEGLAGGTHRIGPFGGRGGKRFEQACEEGRALLGLHGRTGGSVDAIGALCPPTGKPAPAAAPDTDSTLPPSKPARLPGAPPAKGSNRGSIP